jgi:dihydrofolate synthase/folylpolyglutamate synthase
MACALQALALAGALPDREVLVPVLSGITIEGRMQVLLHNGVECILDVAHNPDGVRSLVQRLRARPVSGRTVVVMGAMRDKDCEGMISSLTEVAESWFFATLAGERAQSAPRLAALLGNAAPSRCHGSIAEALGAAFETLAPGDRLLVCGSFHAVGPALDWFDEQREGTCRSP